MTRFHYRQPGLADLQREICTFGNLSFKQLHSVVFGRNCKPAAVVVRYGPAFAAHASGGRMSDAPQFGCIRVRLRACGRKHSAVGALHVSAFVQRCSKIIPCSIAQLDTAGCGWDLTLSEICYVALKLKARSVLRS